MDPFGYYAEGIQQHLDDAFTGPTAGRSSEDSPTPRVAQAGKGGSARPTQPAEQPQMTQQQQPPQQPSQSPQQQPQQQPQQAQQQSVPADAQAQVQPASSSNGAEAAAPAQVRLSQAWGGSLHGTNCS